MTCSGAALTVREFATDSQCGTTTSQLDHDLIDVAPAPVFAGLERLYDRVVGGVEVPGGMLVLRGIAAANMPAFEAETQVYPRIADFQTILTPIGARCDLSYLIKMCTYLCHKIILV